MSRTYGAAEAASPARPTSIDGAHGPSPRREPMYGAEATERSLYSRRANSLREARRVRWATRPGTPGQSFRY